MHVGQQEGHADGQDNRGGQKSPVVRLAAENQQGGQHGRSEGEGGQDAQAGGGAVFTSAPWGIRAYILGAFRFR